MMLRATMDTSLRCLKILIRKRPTPVREIARFISSSRSNSSRWVISITESAISATSPAFNGSWLSALSTPLNLAQGGAPVDRYKSEPSWLARIFSIDWISMSSVSVDWM
ncbi:hypothetical protein D9M70_637720 [compost metagenome]